MFPRPAGGDSGSDVAAGALSPSLPVSSKRSSAAARRATSSTDPCLKHQSKRDGDARDNRCVRSEHDQGDPAAASYACEDYQQWWDAPANHGDHLPLEPVPHLVAFVLGTKAEAEDHLRCCALPLAL